LLSDLLRSTRVNSALAGAWSADTILTRHDREFSGVHVDSKPLLRETMKLSIKNPDHCLYCGRQLSIFHRLRDLLYCDNSHRSAHSREVNQLALARLQPESRSPSEIRWAHCERRMRAEDLRPSGDAMAMLKA